MKKKILTIVLLIGMFALPITSKASTYYEEYKTMNFVETLEEEEIELKNKDYKETDDQITIYMFRGRGCDYCKGFLNFLNSISDEYGKYFKLVSFEVWYDQKNAELMDKVSQVTEEPAGGVPYIIIGDKVFPGYMEGLNEEIKSAIKSTYDDNSYDVFKELKSYEEELKKAKAAPFNRVITWNVIMIIIATITIIIVNVCLHNKTMNAITELNTKVDKISKAKK